LLLFCASRGHLLAFERVAVPCRFVSDDTGDDNLLKNCQAMEVLPLKVGAQVRCSLLLLLQLLCLLLPCCSCQG
jgi:hypothetical protein